MKLKPTAQQQLIIDTSKNGKPMKIKAFAGASKTTTLVMVSNELPHRCLYMAYNKNMQLEAAEKFGDNVEVRTVHSMAYQSFGPLIAHKLKRPPGKYVNVCGTASEVARTFKMFDIPLPNGKKILAISLGKCIRDTVNAFENSAEDYLGKKHVRLAAVKKFVQAGLIKADRIEALVLPAAQKLWMARRDPSNPTMATHETYLKLFQLSKPKLNGYKTIFVDEFQDSNDCVLDIALSQDAQVIVVGDDYQAIYQWRGSINALNKVDFPEFALTTSFRFGQSVADVANTILRETVEVDVRGNPALGTQVVQEMAQVPYPYTKIFRTNAALLLEAVELIAAGYCIRIEVDFNDLIRAFESAEMLYAGNVKGVKHDLFLGFESWEDAQYEGQSNGEIARIVKMVENGMASHVKRVLMGYQHPPEPEVTYITAHKSKGLEWDNVVIADDFPEPYKEGEWILDDAERNLAYVANTRAKKILKPGAILEAIFNQKVGYGVMDSDDDDVYEAGRAAFAAHFQQGRDYEGDFAAKVQREMVAMGHAPWTEEGQLVEYALGPILQEVNGGTQTGMCPTQQDSDFSDGESGNWDR